MSFVNAGGPKGQKRPFLLLFMQSLVKPLLLSNLPLWRSWIANASTHSAWWFPNHDCISWVFPIHAPFTGKFTDHAKPLPDPARRAVLLPEFVFHFNGSPSFVRKWRKSWLAWGSSGRRVILLPRKRFLHKSWGLRTNWNPWYKIFIWIFDFGAENWPGPSRNGPLGSPILTGFISLKS